VGASVNFVKPATVLIPYLSKKGFKISLDCPFKQLRLSAECGDRVDKECPLYRLPDTNFVVDPCAGNRGFLRLVVSHVFLHAI
jgi:hypothetical protein